MKKFLIGILAASFIGIASAADLPSGQLAEEIWNWFIENWAVWIVVFAIVGAGIMALTNRIEWKYFFLVLFGCILLFGAKKIADKMKEWATSSNIEIEEIQAAPVFVQLDSNKIIPLYKS